MVLVDAIICGWAFRGLTVFRDGGGCWVCLLGVDILDARKLGEFSLGNLQGNTVLGDYLERSRRSWSKVEKTKFNVRQVRESGQYGSCHREKIFSRVDPRNIGKGT